MTKYEFAITIPAGGAAAVSLAAAAIAAGAVAAGYSVLYSASYLPACKLFFQMAIGAAAGLGFLGVAGVTSAGLNADYQFGAATATVPGGSGSIESNNDNNSINLGQFYAHGAHAGDLMIVSYWQN